MFDFVRFAADHHVPTITEGHHHCHQGWIQTHCPQCTDGRFGWHLGFSVEKGNLSCWRCGSVRWLTLIQAVARIGVEQAKEIRQRYERYEGKGERKALLRARKRGTTKKPPGCGPLTKRHIQYLREDRGLRQIRKLIKTWGLLGTENFSKEWNWRVVAPIYNKREEVVAYVGRSIVRKMKPKYRVTDEDLCAEDPEGFLYGIHKVPGDAVIIVEGPGDVWKIGPGAVATMGITWHPKQANKLRRFKRRYIMYDPDPKAQESARKLAEWLSLFPGETEIIDDLSSDPGSMKYKTVRKLRRELAIGEAA